MRRRHYAPTVLGLALSLAAVPAGAQTKPTTAPTLAQLQAKERADTVKQLADRPVLPPAPLADVARLGLDGDRLVVTSRLVPTRGPARIEITDLPGVCSVIDAVLHRPGGVAVAPAAAGHAGDGPSDAMLLDWYQFDRPDATIVCTSVEVLPANVQVSRSADLADGGDWQVQLTELRRPTPAAGDSADDADPGVRLKVNGSRGTGEWTADTFAGLCRQQPGPVTRYLEPIFRDLHADAAVLPPDTPLAYEAFAADVVVDPPTAARVRTLVAQLDADDFHDRDAAGEQLSAMGPVAAAAVARVDPAKLSPEQQARTAAIVRRFRPVGEADAKRLSTDVDFLLNCLKDTDPFVVREAIDRLRAVTGRDIAFDVSLQGEARRDRVWQLRQQLTAAPATRP